MQVTQYRRQMYYTVYIHIYICKTGQFSSHSLFIIGAQFPFYWMNTEGYFGIGFASIIDSGFTHHWFRFKADSCFMLSISDGESHSWAQLNVPHTVQDIFTIFHHMLLFVCEMWEFGDFWKHSDKYLLSVPVPWVLATGQTADYSPVKGRLLFFHDIIIIL